MRRLVRVVLTVAAAYVAVTACAITPASAGLFSAVEPELIYTGNGPGLTEGVLVIRDENDWKQAVASLDPAFGADMPDLKKRTVLRIVGRERENRCRETALLEVSTKNLTATAKLEERIPGADCPCQADKRPPKVFLVTVGRSIRYGTIDKTDKVIPCPEAVVEQKKLDAKPQLLFEGSWQAEAGGKLIADAPEYKQVLTKLGIPDRGPVVDFEKERVVVVTGRPREDSCRRTRVVANGFASKEEAVFEVEEVFGDKGQACAKVTMQPVMFLYRVPATVMKVRVVSKEVH